MIPPLPPVDNPQIRLIFQSSLVRRFLPGDLSRITLLLEGSLKQERRSFRVASVSGPFSKTDGQKWMGTVGAEAAGN